MTPLNRLYLEMIQYYAGDPKRIQHFTKVHEYARLIGECEQIDERTLFVLETAAIVHDIGIKVAEEKYGKCGGNLQELEGPAVARDMLNNLSFDPHIVERVCYLVAHHHTYTDVDGIDYRILIEADFLVNLYEDNLSEPAVRHALNNIFRTKTGKEICQNMFFKLN